MKKAAVGGGVAAAAWAAPRVEGMRLVPDYAAASTVAICDFEHAPSPNPCSSNESGTTLTTDCGCTIEIEGKISNDNSANAKMRWTLVGGVGSSVTLVECGSGNTMGATSGDPGVEYETWCDPCIDPESLTWTVTCIT